MYLFSRPVCLYLLPDADPFASHYNGSDSFTTYDSPPTSASTQSGSPTTFIPAKETLTKKRGSILIAASDALNFGRGLGASLTRRRSKSQQSQPPPTLLKARKPKRRGKSAGLDEVIEVISGDGDALRRSHEEDEQRERERLRVAAAESIGLSPLIRNDVHVRAGSSDIHEGYDLVDMVDLSATDAREVAMMRESMSDGQTNIAGSELPMNNSSGSLLQPKLNGTRSHRSASFTTSVGSPMTSGLRGRASSVGHSGVANGPASTMTVLNEQRQPPVADFPTFPCTLNSLGPYVQLSSMLQRHYPSPSLLIFALTRQWRARFVVLTSPTKVDRPSSLSKTPPSPAAYHLHLFKLGIPGEKELERLEINENSVVYVAEEEVAGRRSVVKVGGVDVGAKRKDGNVEENGRTLWLLQTVQQSEAQKWITAIKNAVLVQRAAKVGLGMLPHTSGVSEPKGDMDVMLTMRVQAASAPGTIAYRSSPDSKEGTLVESPVSEVPPVDLTSTQTTIRPKFRESRPTPIAVSALKGLFASGSAPRSPSRASVTPSSACGETEESYAHSNIASSELHQPTAVGRGNPLLNLLRSNGSINCRSPPSSPPQSPRLLPGSLRPSSPGLAALGSGRTTPTALSHMSVSTLPPEVKLDRPIAKNRGLPELAHESIPEKDERGSLSSQTQLQFDSLSINSQQSLRPPPRRVGARPWTSPGPSKMEEQVYYNNSNSLEGPDSAAQSPHSSSVDIPSGGFGTPEHRPRRTSGSSSISSFASAFADPQSERLERSDSVDNKRRSRTGMKIPKMLAPPTGPPPSIPSHSKPTAPKISTSFMDRAPHPYASSSSTTSDSLTQSAPSSARRSHESDFHLHTGGKRTNRISVSSAFSVSTSASTSQSRIHAVPTFSLGFSSKRLSLPPPPRPAPTFSLPPTPGEKEPSSAPARRTSFRESFTQRTSRLSMSPPITDAPNVIATPSSRRNSESHRRSTSSSSLSNANNNNNRSTNIVSLYTIPASPVPPAPPAPPPTGPLPPTPHSPNLLSRHSSLKQRLRIKTNSFNNKSTIDPCPSPTSAILDSHPHNTLLGPPPCFNCDGISNYQSTYTTPQPFYDLDQEYDQPHSPLLLGEPITTRQNDPNFLNMSPLDSPPASVTHSPNIDFLHFHSPTPTPAVPIPLANSNGNNGFVHPLDGSPASIELTSLSPPPRRGARQAPSPLEKETDDRTVDSHMSRSPPLGDRGLSHQHSIASLGLTNME